MALTIEISPTPRLKRLITDMVENSATTVLVEFALVDTTGSTEFPGESVLLTLDAASLATYQAYIDEKLIPAVQAYKGLVPPPVGVTLLEPQ